MNPDDIVNNMPDGWFEDEGVKLTDSPQAIFLHDGQPSLGLFVRSSNMFTAPMAVSRTGTIYVVVDSEVEGYFRPSVRLTLKDKDGDTTGLKIPLATLAKGFEDSAVKFLAWARAASPMLNVMPLPSYMFAQNIKMQL
jgi:hypothetical protein